MLTLYTNYPEFSNDIAEVVRLYTDKCDIAFCNEKTRSGDFINAELSQTQGSFIAKVYCSIGGNNADYIYEYRETWHSELERKRYLKRCVKIATYRALKKIFQYDMPWGSLTGIRPTRLLRELSERNDDEAAKQLVMNEFDVSREKYELAREINAIQAQILDKEPQKNIDIYVGIPFCVSRCLYCSFASQVRNERTNVAAYIQALLKDISLGANIVRDSGLNIRNAYMGGGTPTSLTASELDEVLSCICENYDLRDREFTVEAGRPDTIDEAKLSCLKAHGVNRISINPQTMNDATLKLMGRTHTAEDTERIFHLAREVGFDSINMDIICGLPGESVLDVERSLERISKLRPDNLTVHTLALKRSSRLVENLGEYTLSDAETVAQMTELGEKYARAVKMRPYYMYRQKYMRGSLENIGYALKGKECVYNIDMMEDTTSIMSHGANSMTKRIFDAEVRVMRIPNPKDVATYINKLETITKEKRELFTKPGL